MIKLRAFSINNDKEMMLVPIQHLKCSLLVCSYGPNMIGHSVGPVIFGERRLVRREAQNMSGLSRFSHVIRESRPNCESVMGPYLAITFLAHLGKLELCTSVSIILSSDSKLVDAPLLDAVLVLGRCRRQLELVGAAAPPTLGIICGLYNGT